jgi:hypothetical protein
MIFQHAHLFQITFPSCVCKWKTQDCRGKLRTYYDCLTSGSDFYDQRKLKTTLQGAVVKKVKQDNHSESCRHACTHARTHARTHTHTHTHTAHRHTHKHNAHTHARAHKHNTHAHTHRMHTHISKTIFSEKCIITRTEIL